jgi:CheY-like chemotaxis protein
MTPEVIEKLFIPFEQADNNITRMYGGTGLGLPIAKGVIDTMKGTIAVASEPGKGSLFTVKVNLEEAPPELVREKAEAGKAAALAGKKILVVDDVALNREILSALFEETSAKVSEAVNGKEAVEMAARDVYDCILMDLHMPVMDGYEATKRIRLLEIDTPIIAVTADSGSEVISRCLECGMNDHIEKPVDAATLLETLEQQFNRLV